MGSNKFDGSRLWMGDYWGWEDGMNPSDIKSIFTVGSRIRSSRTLSGHVLYQTGEYIVLESVIKM